MIETKNKRSGTYRELKKRAVIVQREYSHVDSIDKNYNRVLFVGEILYMQDNEFTFQQVQEVKEMGFYVQNGFGPISFRVPYEHVAFVEFVHLEPARAYVPQAAEAEAV